MKSTTDTHKKSVGRPKSSSPERKRELARLRKAKQARRDRAAREIGKRLKQLSSYDRLPWLELLAHLFDGEDPEIQRYSILFIEEDGGRHDYESITTDSDGAIDVLLSSRRVLEIKWA